MIRVDTESVEMAVSKPRWHNRTDHQSGLVVPVEIRNNDGTRLDNTPYQNVAVEPRGETVFNFPVFISQAPKFASYCVP